MQIINWQKQLEQARRSLQSGIQTLEENGPAPSFTDPQILNCPICKGQGFVYQDLNLNDPQFGKAIPCKCMKMNSDERKRMYLMKFCDFPEDADRLTFENFEVKESNRALFEAALEFVSGGKVFLTLSGPVNTGKSHIAVAICHEYIDSGIPAKFAFTPDLLVRLRDTFNKDADWTYLKLYNRYCEVPLLVLDDIFAEKRSEWTDETLTSLVNNRYMNKKPTIFTTNKTVPEMIDLNERLASRLQRESWCRVVSL